jgi:hypothetical protein
MNMPTVFLVAKNRTLLIGQAFGIGVVVGLLGVAVLFHNLFGKPIATTLWADNLDPNGIVWTLEWGYHIIFERLDPFDFWNANSYFPHAKSLAFADSMITAQLLYAPLRILGFGPLYALYFTLAGFCIIGAVLTDQLLRKYDFAAGERALVVVAAHFSLPITGFLYHYQLFGMELASPFFLALHRLINTWQGKELVLVTVLFCLASGFAAYFAPMAIVVGASAVFIFSSRILRSQSFRIVLQTLGWRSLALSSAILALFVIVQLSPYVSLFGSLPPQQMSETFLYSARPWSVLLHPSGHSYWYRPFRPFSIDYGYWERAAFPGLSLLLLAAGGAIAIVKRVPASLLEGAAKPVVPLAVYGVTILTVSWILSWGPFIQLGGEKLSLPFLVIAKAIPGMGHVRAPGRFAQFYGLPLGLLAVVSVRWVGARFHLSASVVGAVIAAVVLIDQMPKVPTFPFSIAHADFWQDARPLIEEGKPIIVLPIAGADHFETVANRGRQLVSSTIHWAKMVTGYGSRDTPELSQLIGLDNQLRSGTASLADVVTYARKLGIDKIVLFPGDYPPEVRARIVGETDRLAARATLKNSEGIIMQLAK